MTPAELKAIKDTGMIPDALLNEYLADKLLVKPDYQSVVGYQELSSDFSAVQARMAAMRGSDNDRVKNANNLRRKK